MNRSVLPPSGVDEICTVYWLFGAVCLLNCSEVRALTVPMHLGLIDGPFCPTIWYQLNRALFLYQSSRWPPSLKILMTSGCERGTQIYYHFLWKSPASESPSRFSTCPLSTEISSYGAFLHYSCYIYLFPTIPGKGVPYMHPYWVHTDRDTPSPEPLPYVYIHPFVFCLPQSRKGAPT